MSKIAHFEIQADDIDRAKKFYTAIFPEWSFEDWSKMAGSTYWGITTGEKGKSLSGGLQQRPVAAPKPEQGTNAFVITIQVENYDEMHEKILEAGGTVALPKFAFAGMAWQGYYIDTEGNTFGIHQADENAK